MELKQNRVLPDVRNEAIVYDFIDSSRAGRHMQAVCEPAQISK